ncbi:RNA polymerase sigma factor [Streptomyces sp. WMMC500]|nr:RNA polymerase sigma factor [Streptomyces sp. WMMC500]WBB62046.1 RNA polymerase sigma factor [Streptomyces sp. WMMC500]
MSHAQPAHALAAVQPAPAAEPVPTQAPVARLGGRGRQVRSSAAEQYRSRLLRYVSRLTAGDTHRAEDIVQETMLRAWLSAEEFLDEEGGFPRDEDHLAAWLHTVARNLAIDAYRRDRRLVPIGGKPATIRSAAADDAVEEGTDTVADGVIDRVVVVGLLARLAPHHRDVLIHVHLFDRSREETGRLLGIPTGTVKSRLHYALSMLREELAA